MKKKNEKFQFTQETVMGDTAGKNNTGGLRIETKGLSLATSVKACNEGMSPLMERFQRSKIKANTNLSGISHQQQ